MLELWYSLILSALLGAGEGHGHWQLLIDSRYWKKNFVGTIFFFAKTRILHINITLVFPLVFFKLHFSNCISCPSCKTSVAAGLEAPANTTLYAHARGYTLLRCCFVFFIIVCGPYLQASKSSSADSYQGSRVTIGSFYFDQIFKGVQEAFHRENCRYSLGRGRKTVWSISTLKHFLLCVLKIENNLKCPFFFFFRAHTGWNKIYLFPLD